MWVSSLKLIHCCCREVETPDTKRFKDMDVTLVEMVPYPTRNSMDSGVQSIIVQRRTPPPCNRVNQEQSDTILARSISMRQEAKIHHWRARGKAFPIEDSTYCARRSRQYSVRQTRMKRVGPSLVWKTTIQREQKNPESKRNT